MLPLGYWQLVSSLVHQTTLLTSLSLIMCVFTRRPGEFQREFRRQGSQRRALLLSSRCHQRIGGIPSSEAQSEERWRGQAEHGTRSTSDGRRRRGGRDGRTPDTSATRQRPRSELAHTTDDKNDFISGRLDKSISQTETESGGRVRASCSSSLFKNITEKPHLSQTLT